MRRKKKHNSNGCRCHAVILLKTEGKRITHTQNENVRRPKAVALLFQIVIFFCSPRWCSSSSFFFHFHSSRSCRHSAKETQKSNVVGPTEKNQIEWMWKINGQSFTIHHKAHWLLEAQSMHSSNQHKRTDTKYWFFFRHDCAHRSVTWNTHKRPTTILVFLNRH